MLRNVPSLFEVMARSLLKDGEGGDQTMSHDIGAIVDILLPGGILAAIMLLVQAWNSYRESKSKDEETVLGRWQRMAKENERRGEEWYREAEYRAELAEYWRLRSADLEYKLRANNIEVPPLGDPPTKRLIQGLNGKG